MEAHLRGEDFPASSLLLFLRARSDEQAAPLGRPQNNNWQGIESWQQPWGHLQRAPSPVSLQMRPQHRQCVHHGLWETLRLRTQVSCARFLDHRNSETIRVVRSSQCGPHLSHSHREWTQITPQENNWPNLIQKGLENLESTTIKEMEPGHKNQSTRKPGPD